MSVQPSTWTLDSATYLQKVAIGPTNQFQVAIQYNGSSTDATVIYSRDFGVSWDASTGITGNANCISSNGQNVLVGVNSVASHLYYSNDYGTSFTALSNSPVSYWTVVGVSDIGSNYMLACDFSGDTATIYYTTNGGYDWSTLNTYSGVIITDGAWSNADSMNTMYFVGNMTASPYYTALFVTTDQGSSWNALPDITSYNIRGVACDKTGQNVVISVSQDGVYRSTNYGASWAKTSAPSSPPSGPNMGLIACDYTGNQIVVMDMDSHVLYASSDAGLSWVLQTTTGSGGAPAILNLSMSPDGSYRYVSFPTVGTYSIVLPSYKSVNFSNYSFNPLMYVTANNMSGQHMAAIGSNGYGQRKCLVYSSDYGLTWNLSNADASGDSVYTCMAASANGQYVVAGFENGPNGVVFSSDYGVQYSIVSTGLNFTPYSIAISNDGQYFYAMTSDGSGEVYVGTATGAIVSQNAGVPSMFWNSVASDSTGRYVYATAQGAGTNAHSLFKADFGTPSIYLPLNGSVTDVMTNSTISQYGSMAYVSGYNTVNALSLVNPSNTGGAPTNYVSGTIASITNDFTASCYFNVQSYPVTGQSVVFSLGDQSNAVFYLTIQQNGTGYVQMYANDSSYPSVALGAIALDTWYSFLTTFTPSGDCFTYLNGALVGTIVVGRALYTTPNQFSLSSYTSSVGGSFNGYIEDFRIFNTVGAYGLWTEVPRFTSSSLVPLSVASDTTGQILTVSAGTDGIYQSVNGGATWILKDALTAQVIDPLALGTFTPIQSGLLSNSWTNHGVNWVSSASTYQPNQDPFIPFKDTLDNSWNTVTNHYNPSGNDSGIFSTFYTTGSSTMTVQGDWLQLKSSTPLIMKSYQIGCGNANNLPGMFYIVGSNDETNWYALQYAVAGAKPFDAIYTMVPGTITVNSSSGQTWGGTTLTTTAYPGATQAYTYFRIILLSSFYGPGTCAQIGKWIIDFLPTATPIIELPLTDSLIDLMNNSTVTGYGAVTYLSTAVLSNAINLANTAGGGAANYVRGAWTGATNFTIRLRVNLQSLGAIQTIFSAYGTNIYLYVDGSNILKCAIPNGGGTGQHTLDSATTLTNNTWYRIAVVFKANDVCTLSIDDIVVASYTNTGGVGTLTTASFGIGTYDSGDNGQALNGYISDVRIYTTDTSTPFIYLPFNTAPVDMMGNSALTIVGSLSYVTGTNETYALDLTANTAGGTPSTYVRGTYNYAPNFTVMGRFNLVSSPPNGEASTIFCMGTTSQTFFLLQYCNNANLYGVNYFTGLVAYGYDVNNTPFLIGTTSTDTNTWYQFQLTYQESGMMSAYLNGVHFGTISGTPLLDTPTMYSIGSVCHAAVNAFRGDVSDLRIYNSVLSPPTRRSLTNIASDSTGTNLVAADAEFNTVYRSSDSGASWASQIVNNGNPLNNFTIQSISTDPTGTYAFVSYGNDGTYMSQRSSGLTTDWTLTPGVYYPIVTYSNDNQYQTAITTQYGFTTTGHSVISYSTDAGVTWTQGPDLNGYVTDLAADSTGQYVVAILEMDLSTLPSVYRSTDYGATFTALLNSPDYNHTGINCIACNSTGQLLYAGAYDGNVYISTNAGVDWSFPIAMSNYVHNIICSHSGQYVYALVGDYICISTNYGQSWSSLISISLNGCSEIACDWTGQYIVAACYNDGVYRSTDYGQTWTQTSAPFNSNVGGAQNYFYIACNSTGNRILTFDGNNGTVYLSLDAGATWVLQYTPDSTTNEAFMGVSVSPDGTRYAADFWTPGTYFLTAGSPDIPNAIPCFLEGSQILCQVAGVDTYVNVEAIRPGMMVKTSRDGYKAVKLIGSRAMTNPGTADRNKNSLYLCTKAAYPELTADVTLTGCHAILVDKITDAHRAGIIATLQRVFVTDKKYRLPACVDERASVVQTAGAFTVWHFALDHYDTRMNYGVYAQGLLVESSPICHMNTKNYNLVQ